MHKNNKNKIKMESDMNDCIQKHSTVFIYLGVLV